MCSSTSSCLLCALLAATLCCAERAKESTLGVTMVAQAARSLPSGPAGAHCWGKGWGSCMPAVAINVSWTSRQQLDVEQAALCQTAVYDFEYELESTRGRKRILSTGQWGFCASWHRQEEG